MKAKVKKQAKKQRKAMKIIVRNSYGDYVVNGAVICRRDWIRAGGLKLRVGRECTATIKIIVKKVGRSRRTNY